MTRKRSKVEIYEEALITIWKLAGRVWADNRWCHDSSYLAGESLKKANPKLYNKLDNLLCVHMSVMRSGRIKWPKKITKDMLSKDDKDI